MNAVLEEIICFTIFSLLICFVYLCVVMGKLAIDRIFEWFQRMNLRSKSTPFNLFLSEKFFVVSLQDVSVAENLSAHRVFGTSVAIDAAGGGDGSLLVQVRPN